MAAGFADKIRAVRAEHTTIEDFEAQAELVLEMIHFLADAGSIETPFGVQWSAEIARELQTLTELLQMIEGKIASMLAADAELAAGVITIH